MSSVLSVLILSSSELLLVNLSNELSTMKFPTHLCFQFYFLRHSNHIFIKRAYNLESSDFLSSALSIFHHPNNQNEFSSYISSKLLVLIFVSNKVICHLSFSFLVFYHPCFQSWIYYILCQTSF